MQEFWNNIVNWFQGLGRNFIIGLVILIIGLIVVKIIKTIVKSIFKRRKQDEAMSHFIVSLLDVILKLVVLVCALATMGVNTASIIAVLGTCGVAIGLALKDSLGNLASGILILYNKPFKKGDWIEVGGVSGSVDAINLFNTTLITADNKIVVLPNSVASNNPIVNFNGSDIRRLDIVTNVAKGTDIDEVRELLLKVADEDEDVSKDIAAAVYMIDPQNCFVNLELRVWVPATKWWDVKFRLNEKVYNALKDASLLPPNPATDVNLNK